MSIPLPPRRAEPAALTRMVRVAIAAENGHDDGRAHDGDEDQSGHADTLPAAKLLAQIQFSLMSINEYDQWLGVELRHLAALEAVAEEGSFGRAARRLGYTQSAVSQQIAQLEKLVGARLLERPGGPRAVSLTDAGRLLLRHADAIVARLAAAQADMAALQAGEAGPLRVGILQSVGARLLPQLISRFKQEFPRVSVQVIEGNTPEELLPL